MTWENPIEAKKEEQNKTKFIFGFRSYLNISASQFDNLPKKQTPGAAANPLAWPALVSSTRLTCETP